MIKSYWSLYVSQTGLFDNQAHFAAFLHHVTDEPQFTVMVMDRRSKPGRRTAILNTFFRVLPIHPDKLVFDTPSGKAGDKEMHDFYQRCLQ